MTRALQLSTRRPRMLGPLRQSCVGQPQAPACRLLQELEEVPACTRERALAPSLRYAVGMTRKIAISLPDATLGKARAAVKDRGVASLSSYIGRLIEDASAAETFEEMLAAWVQESGATPAEIRSAQKESLEAFARAGLIGSRKRREKATRKAG
jgi:hypothetical protein